MEEFRICSSCGYARGFHVFFREEAGRHRIGLICPGCGQSFDIGWLSEDISGSEAKPGDVFPSR